MRMAGQPRRSNLRQVEVEHKHTHAAPHELGHTHHHADPPAQAAQSHAEPSRSSTAPVRRATVASAFASEFLSDLLIVFDCFFWGQVWILLVIPELSLSHKFIDLLCFLHLFFVQKCHTARGQSI